MDQEIGVKCLKCGLHFTIWTWYGDRHAAKTIYCPECGQHDGHYIVYRRDLKMPIFMNVPGSMTPSEINVPKE